MGNISISSETLHNKPLDSGNDFHSIYQCQKTRKDMYEACITCEILSAYICIKLRTCMKTYIAIYVFGLYT